jgi:hypothetical protein
MSRNTDQVKSTTLIDISLGVTPKQFCQFPFLFVNNTDFRSSTFKRTCGGISNLSGRVMVVTITPVTPKQQNLDPGLVDSYSPLETVEIQNGQTFLYPLYYESLAFEFWTAYKDSQDKPINEDGICVEVTDPYYKKIEFVDIQDPQVSNMLGVSIESQNLAKPSDIFNVGNYSHIPVTYKTFGLERALTNGGQNPIVSPISTTLHCVRAKRAFIGQNLLRARGATPDENNINLKQTRLVWFSFPLESQNQATPSPGLIARTCVMDDQFIKANLSTGRCITVLKPAMRNSVPPIVNHSFNELTLEMSMNKISYKV